jgi:hypothetical protein
MAKKICDICEEEFEDTRSERTPFRAGIMSDSPSNIAWQLNVCYRCYFMLMKKRSITRWGFPATDGLAPTKEEIAEIRKELKCKIRERR